MKIDVDYGTDLSEAKLRAAEVAVQTKKPVTFEFNNEIYTVGLSEAASVFSPERVAERVRGLRQQADALQNDAKTAQRNLNVRLVKEGKLATLAKKLSK